MDRWRRSSRSKSPLTAQNLERVARFWCEVLGYVVPPPPEGFATWGDFDRAPPPEHQGSAFACVDPSGVSPRLFFQRVPEGKVVKNRLHLDVRVGTGLVGDERPAALLRPNAHDWSRSARYACDYCAPTGHQRVVPRDAGRRGQRVLSRLSGPRARAPSPAEGFRVLAASAARAPSASVTFGIQEAASPIPTPTRLLPVSSSGVTDAIVDVWGTRPSRRGGRTLGNLPPGAQASAELSSRHSGVPARRPAGALDKPVTPPTRSGATRLCGSTGRLVTGGSCRPGATSSARELLAVSQTVPAGRA